MELIRQIQAKVKEQFGVQLEPEIQFLGGILIFVIHQRRKNMRFVIVTGMSGAGKSTALKMLEDAEYFCVDNLPIPLVEKFCTAYRRRYFREKSRKWQSESISEAARRSRTCRMFWSG